MKKIENSSLMIDIQYDCERFKPMKS